MLNSDEKKYYSRHLLLNEFGEENQLKLKNSSVLVIGAGGLGCPSLQYLVAAGVGNVRIMDGDTVDISNLHRQILFSHEDIGESKAEVATQKLTQLNPHVNITAVKEWLTKENALEYIKDHDVILDCSDNFETRYLVNDACVIEKKPFIYGAISKFEGQISVSNHQDGPTYRCLFPEPPSAKDAPNCADAGVLGVLPGIIGTNQALECIKLLTGMGELLSGKLLIIDTLGQHHIKLTISTVPSHKEIKILGDYNVSCSSEIQQIDYSKTLELLEQKTFLLDVRSEEEYQLQNIGGLLIPLAELENSLKIIPNKEIIVVCQSGKRSAAACELLIQNGFDRVYNLKGGLNSIER
ncbi:MAG: HesA/MoeB/ThiF family protein [Crocinitomicaceae bacterium]|nr:HesA/MoeB/ThiF family protein [Crocinitomicaceae bacterium]